MSVGLQRGRHRIGRAPQPGGRPRSSPVTDTGRVGGTDPSCTAIAATPPAPSSPLPAPSGSPAAAIGELTVYAAASLKGAFEAFAPAYTAETGLSPVYSFDASSALRTQIEQAAPADVFASADVANVQALVAAGLAHDPIAFACNQLTIIVPAGNPAGITSAADLGKPGVKVIAAGPDVPITKYATQLVANLGIAEAYAANVATEEDNVAAVRAKVEAGEGDVAVVYVTDALASGDRVAADPGPRRGQRARDVRGCGRDRQRPAGRVGRVPRLPHRTGGPGRSRRLRLPAGARALRPASVDPCPAGPWRPGAPVRSRWAHQAGRANGVLGREAYTR